MHDGKQRLSASNHLAFPYNRTRSVSNAHKRFRSPTRNPSHVSESAVILTFGSPSKPSSTVIFPPRNRYRRLGWLVAGEDEMLGGVQFSRGVALKRHAHCKQQVGDASRTQRVPHMSSRLVRITLL